MEYANIFTDIAIAIWVVMYLAIGIIILRATRYGDVVAMLAGDGFPKTAVAMLLGFVVLWPLYPVVLLASILYGHLPHVKRQREKDQAERDYRYKELRRNLNRNGTEFYGERMK